MSWAIYTASYCRDHDIFKDGRCDHLYIWATAENRCIVDNLSSIALFCRVPLHSLLSTLGAKEEIWSVGRMSRNIGDLLESWTPVRNRRKEAENWVSLILVDRTLDLASSVMVGGDSLLCRATQLMDNIPSVFTKSGWWQCAWSAALTESEFSMFCFLL